MSLHCLKECGFCARVIAEDEPCLDLLGTKECEILKEEKECLVNPTFATYNCRKTCDACPGDIERKMLQWKIHNHISHHQQHSRNNIEFPSTSLLADAIGMEMKQVEQFIEKVVVQKDMGQLRRGEFVYAIGFLAMVCVFSLKYGRNLKKHLRLTTWKKSN
jgi:hypothetical protein